MAKRPLPVSATHSRPCGSRARPFGKLRPPTPPEADQRSFAADGPTAIGLPLGLGVGASVGTGVGAAAATGDALGAAAVTPFTAADGAGEEGGDGVAAAAADGCVVTATVVAEGDAAG